MASRCRPRTGSRWSINESLLSTLVKIDGESLGQIYAVQASFRLIEHQPTRRWCCRAPATPAPASSASTRSTPTCGRARTPRTGRPRTIADDLKIAPCDLPVRRGLSACSAVAAIPQPAIVRRDHGRHQDPPGRRLPEGGRSRPARRCCSMAATRGSLPSGPRSWPSAWPSVTTRRARSSASTMPSLEDDPDRIFVELQTAPMFGGRKIVRATAGRRITAAALKPLVEGGDLRRLPDRRGRQPAARRCPARAVREIPARRRRRLLPR